MPFERHPELLGGEVFISNINPNSRAGHFRITSLLIGDVLDERSDWECIGWETKRMGKVAYDIHNIPIDGMRPVFAQKSELEKDGFIFPSGATTVDEATRIDEPSPSIQKSQRKASERYEKIIASLTERFKTFLETIPPLAMARGEFHTGVDALPEDVRSEVMRIMRELQDEENYEVSHNQLCRAFFGATHELGHLRITD